MTDAGDAEQHYGSYYAYESEELSAPTGAGPASDGGSATEYSWERDVPSVSSEVRRRDVRRDAPIPH